MANCRLTTSSSATTRPSVSTTWQQTLKTILLSYSKWLSQCKLRKIYLPYFRHESQKSSTATTAILETFTSIRAVPVMKRSGHVLPGNSQIKTNGNDRSEYDGTGTVFHTNFITRNTTTKKKKTTQTRDSQGGGPSAHANEGSSNGVFIVNTTHVVASQNERNYS